MNLKVLQVIAVICSYCLVSITLVFVNKYLVGSERSGADLSLFVVWVQCIVTALFVTIVNLVKTIWSGDWTNMAVSSEELFSGGFVRMSFSLVSMLAFNNLCLRHVDVAFYQVARSMTIIFVVIFTIVILRKLVSLRVVACCAVITLGFILGVDQEQLLGTLSVRGVIFGVLSSVFVALNGVFIKQALDIVHGNSYKVTYYGNINASILFIPILVVTGQLQEAGRTFPTWGVTFWGFLLSTGVLCFFMAWIAGVQINLTSVVTHHVITNTKSVLQTLIAVVYYQEHKSGLWWLSVLLVVGGAFSYTMVRLKDEENEKKKPAAESEDEVCAVRDDPGPNGTPTLP